MKPLLRLSNLFGMIVLIGALGFLIRINTVRTQRVVHLIGLTQSAPPATDAASVTGYAGGIRELIVPEHNNDSYQWLAQTQLMLASHTWRLRHVDYDNAPSGRDIRTPSPYRWWLGLVTWFEHRRTGLSIPLAVEQAALSADPALQILLIAATVLFTVRCFGVFAASLLCLGLTGVFPFAAAFLPGQVSDFGLSLFGALWSMLPLLAGVRALADTKNANAGRVARRCFAFAGFAAAVSLWISIPREIPVLAGIVVGGILAAFLLRRDPAAKPLPWRAWALSGTVTVIVVFLIEYFPSHLALKEWRLDTIHPWYALAWLGVGELLVQADAWFRQGKSAWSRRRITITLLALLAVASVPLVVFLRTDRAWLSADAFAFRLTNLPNGPAAGSLAAWLARDHFNAALAATFLPLLFLFPASWLIARRATANVHRTVLAVTLGPVFVAAGPACFRLHGWNPLDAALLATSLAVTLALNTARARWLWGGLVGIAAAAGAVVSFPHSDAAADSVSETEVVSLVERDLAHWLANRAGSDGATVLAPPSLTTSLYYHGGLRGIGTPYAENKDGFAAAVRLSAASSADEALALVQKRHVTHIILPSWDTFLNEYARIGSAQPERSLVGLLHQWLPPRWLRPVSYHLPQITGFDGHVAIFEVVELQDNATALSNLAEYFAEMGQLDQAAAVSRTLAQSFPTDLGSLVAQAQVAGVLQDQARFAALIATLVPRLNGDEATALAWDRRVSLAIVLAEGKRFEPAKEQVQRCLAEMDEPLMRLLPTVALYRLQVLAKAFHLEIPEPTLRDLGRNLLSPEMRDAL